MKNYRRQLKRSLIFTLLPILLYGVLGPLEIYVGNADEFVFILKDFFGAFLAISILVWLIGSAFLAFLPEKCGNILFVFIFIISVLSYIQNIFLNKKLMNLNGTAMDWGSMHDVTVSNMILWVALSILMAVIPIVWRKHYMRFYMGIAAFVSTIQVVAVISLLITAVPIKYRAMTLSPEGQLDVAPRSNVIVFVLDFCYNSQFEKTIASHPEFAATLKDFTYYDNADCHYNFTFPSLAHMLTGVNYDLNMKPEEWRETCWHEERSQNFFGTLHSSNYECCLYSSGFVTASIGSIENIADLISNTTTAIPFVDSPLLFAVMEKMTIYKYVPYILKPRFEVQSYVVDEAAFWDKNEVPHENGEFFEILTREGLSVDAELENKFTVIHLTGLHTDWHTRADGTYTEEQTTLDEVSDGLGTIMQEYVRQLRNLGGGIYDNATIIITADHGDGPSNPQPIYFIKPPHTEQDEMQITSAPISHDDFQATVLTCIGLDASGYGTSIFDWREGDRRIREYWYPEKWNATTGFYIYTYETDRYELMQMSQNDTVFMEQK